MADKVFPLSLKKTAFNSTVSPQWTVTQHETASGRERSMCSQYYPRYTYSVVFPLLRDDEIDTLLGFFNECRGSHLPFYIKDGLHYRVEDERIVEIDGEYQLVIPRGEYLEPCFKADNVTVKVDGVTVTNYSVADGKIKFDRNPAGKVTASYDYYVKVRFDGNISVTEMYYNANKVSVKFVTVR